MPTQEQRQSQGRRSEDNQCSAHEKNTTDLASVRSSLATLKWGVGLGAPAILAIVAWYANSISTDLNSIKVEVKAMNTSMATFQVNDAVSKLDRDQLRRELEELRGHK